MKKIIGIVLLCIIYIYMIGCNNVNQQSIEHKKEPTSSVITENKNTLSKENAVENIFYIKKSC